MSRERISGLVDFSSLLGDGGAKVNSEVAKEKSKAGSSFFGGLFGIKSVDNGRAGGGGLTGLGRRHVPELGTYTTGEVQVVCEKVSLTTSPPFPLFSSSHSSSLSSPSSKKLNKSQTAQSFVNTHSFSLWLRSAEPPIRNPRPQTNPSLRPLSLNPKRLQVPRPRFRSWSWKGLVRYCERMVREFGGRRGRVVVQVI